MHHHLFSMQRHRELTDHRPFHKFVQYFLLFTGIGNWEFHFTVVDIPLQVVKVKDICGSTSYYCCLFDIASEWSFFKRNIFVEFLSLERSIITGHLTIMLMLMEFVIGVL